MFTKPKRPVDRVFLHCSASDNPAHDNVATMRAWHKANGWSDVGYHLFIRKDGTLEPGRSLELTPAAQSGHNTGTIAICCHGLDERNFTAAQFDTLRTLCGEINAAYGGKVTFHGHCEVSAKACPVYDYRKVLGLDRDGHLTGKPSSAPPADAEEPVDISRVLRRGASGDDVRWLQALLTKALGHSVSQDGDFGPATETAVIGFQRKAHLVADGVVGPLTREALSETLA